MPRGASVAAKPVDARGSISIAGRSGSSYSSMIRSASSQA
jgi:hypothetical protein